MTIFVIYQKCVRNSTLIIISVIIAVSSTVYPCTAFVNNYIQIPGHKQGVGVHNTLVLYIL